MGGCRSGRRNVEETRCGAGFSSGTDVGGKRPNRGSSHEVRGFAALALEIVRVGRHAGGRQLADDGESDFQRSARFELGSQVHPGHRPQREVRLDLVSTLQTEHLLFDADPDVTVVAADFAVLQ